MEDNPKFKVKIGGDAPAAPKKRRNVKPKILATNKSDAQLFRMYNKNTLPLLTPSLEPTKNEIVDSLKKIFDTIHSGNSTMIKGNEEQRAMLENNLKQLHKVRRDNNVDQAEVINGNDVNPAVMGADQSVIKPTLKDHAANVVKDHIHAKLKADELNRKKKAADTLKAFARAKIDANETQPALTSARESAKKIQRAARNYVFKKDPRKEKISYDILKDAIKGNEDGFYLKKNENMNNKAALDIGISPVKAKKGGAGRPRLTEVEKLGNEVMRQTMKRNQPLDASFQMTALGVAKKTTKPKKGKKD